MYVFIKSLNQNMMIIVVRKCAAIVYSTFEQIKNANCICFFLTYFIYLFICPCQCHKYKFLNKFAAFSSRFLSLIYCNGASMFFLFDKRIILFFWLKKLNVTYFKNQHSPIHILPRKLAVNQLHKLTDFFIRIFCVCCWKYKNRFGFLGTHMLRFSCRLHFHLWI